MGWALGESMMPLQAVGGLLRLGFMLYNELPLKKKAESKGMQEGKRAFIPVFG